MPDHDPYTMLEDEGIRRFLCQSDALYPPDATSHNIAEQRKFYDTLCAHFSPPHPLGISVADLTIDGPAGAVPIRLYRPEQDKNALPVLLYLHGGGFILGGLDSHDSICAEISHQAGIAVIAVNYRLTPEHPYPAAFDDARAVLEAIAQLAIVHQLDATRLVVTGDSAGANLTAALCIHARDNSGPAIGGQILVYPELGGDLTKGSYVEMAHAPGLTTGQVAYYRRTYHGPSGSAASGGKFAAPLLETNYHNLPPAFVVAAKWDPLCDDASEYVARLNGAGIAAQIRHEPLLVHAFLRARHMSDPAAASFAAITGAARSLAYSATLPVP